MKNQQGNVLLFILVGIVLFAALSYAVLESDENISSNQDQLRLDIAVTMEHFTQLEAAVHQMVLANGIKDNELEFTNSVIQPWYNSSYINPNCADDSCRVFTPAGGGIDFPIVPKRVMCCTPDNNLNTYYNFDSSYAVPGIGHDDRSELWAYVKVTEEVCIKINDILYIPNPDGLPPKVSTYWFDIFSGNHNDRPDASDAFPLELARKKSGCVNVQPAGTDYKFYHVLLAR